MNKSLKSLSFLLFSISSISVAHEWGFTNITDKTLIIQLKLHATNNVFLNIIGPGEKAMFEWDNPNDPADVCFSDVLMGEYDEKKVAHFPGTESSQLPRQNENNKLDAQKISDAINVPGAWLDSLIKEVNTISLLNFIILDDQRWNEFNSKINQVAEKLMDDMSTQEAMDQIGINISQEIRLSITFAPQTLKHNKFHCNSRNFIIVTIEGTLHLITKK